MLNNSSPNQEDLHAGKDSHASLPVAHDMEFHLRQHDVGFKCKVGEKYYIMVPVEVTSVDKEMTRFKQLSKLEIEPYEEESKETKANKKLKEHIKENY